MKFSKPILVSIAFLANAALISAVLTAGLRQAVPAESPPGQDESPKKQLHGVLSSARLAPPLRGMPRRVRFSSDGEYLFIQLESGIYILNRHPLEIRTWISAPDILPARFSADSKTLILATRSLTITRWNLADNRKLDERILKTQDGCLGSELSIHGELAACLDPSLALELYRTDTGERVFAEPAFSDQEKMAAGIVSTFEIVPRNEGTTAYAEPLGTARFTHSRFWQIRNYSAFVSCSHPKPAFSLCSIVSTGAWSAWTSTRGEKSAAQESLRIVGTRR